MDGNSRKRTPNRSLLREIASILGSETWVETVSAFPSNRPDSIVIELIDDHYPVEYVETAYIEVQSYTNGDFHITYLENRFGDEWLCRWDRHESDDYSTDHFHAPPDTTHAAGVNREFPPALPSVLSRVVVPWVYERMGDVWTEYE